MYTYNDIYTSKGGVRCIQFAVRLLWGASQTLQSAPLALRQTQKRGKNPGNLSAPYPLRRSPRAPEPQCSQGDRNTTASPPATIDAKPAWLGAAQRRWMPFDRGKVAALLRTDAGLLRQPQRRLSTARTVWAKVLPALIVASRRRLLFGMVCARVLPSPVWEGAAWLLQFSGMVRRWWRSGDAIQMERFSPGLAAVTIAMRSCRGNQATAEDFNP